MNNLQMKIIIDIVLFLLIIVSGVIIGRKGKPYNILIFTLHKLVSLAFFVLGIYIVYQHYVNSGFTIFDLILVILAVVVLPVTFGSGGKLSVGENTNNKLQVLHKLGSFLTLILLGGLFYRIY